jgi:hypothetical protein
MKIVIARTYELTEELDKEVAEVAEELRITCANAFRNMYGDTISSEDLVLAEEEDTIIAIYEG